MPLRPRIAESVKQAIRAEYAEGLLGYGKLGIKYGVSKHGVAYIINPESEREAAKLSERKRRADPDVRERKNEYCRQCRNEDPEWTREYERNGAHVGVAEFARQIAETLCLL